MRVSKAFKDWQENFPKATAKEKKKVFQLYHPEVDKADLDSAYREAMSGDSEKKTDEPLKAASDKVEASKPEVAKAASGDSSAK